MTFQLRGISGLIGARRIASRWCSRCAARAFDDSVEDSVWSAVWRERKENITTRWWWWRWWLWWVECRSRGMRSTGVGGRRVNQSMRKVKLYLTALKTRRQNLHPKPSVGFIQSFPCLIDEYCSASSTIVSPQCLNEMTLWRIAAPSLLPMKPPSQTHLIGYMRHMFHREL
jgi:hypothetical protein